MSLSVRSELFPEVELSGTRPVEPALPAFARKPIRISFALTLCHVDPPFGPLKAAAYGAEYSDSVCRRGLPNPRGQKLGAWTGPLPPPGPRPSGPLPVPGPVPVPAASPAPAVELRPLLNELTIDCSCGVGAASGASSA